MREGNTNHMIANWDMLITEYSSIAPTTVALGKEGYAHPAVDFLRGLALIEKGGSSGNHIVELCRSLVATPHLGAVSAGRRVSKRHPVQGRQTP